MHWTISLKKKTCKLFITSVLTRMIPCLLSNKPLVDLNMQCSANPYKQTMTKTSLIFDIGFNLVKHPFSNFVSNILDSKVKHSTGENLSDGRTETLFTSFQAEHVHLSGKASQAIHQRRTSARLEASSDYQTF